MLEKDLRLYWGTAGFSLMPDKEEAYSAFSDIKFSIEIEKICILS